MLKLRITFTDNQKGNKELDDLIDELEKNKKYELLNVSKKYIGRGNSKYSNVYIDLEQKENE